MITTKSNYARIILALLPSVFAVAGDLQEIEPLERVEQGFEVEHFSLESMVKEFGLPDSKLGAIVTAPTGEYFSDREEMKASHFAQSDEHSVVVLYQDATTAVVVATAGNQREGDCKAVFLVALEGKRDSQFGCRIQDCLLYTAPSRYSAMRVGTLKLPQFPKPLLHIWRYDGGRLTGGNCDEWFRIDRGKLEPVLALNTGQYRHNPSSPSGVGVSQDTIFRTKGGKLIAKSERTTEFADKPGKEKNETFETIFTWNKSLGKFTAKSTTKLEIRDRLDAQ